MAAFRQHILVSSALGAGYGALLGRVGLEWTHCVLAGTLCGVAGMLPDLDSDSGRPIRELFGVTAVAVPLLLLQRLQNAGATAEGTILLVGLVYLVIRFGGSWVLKHLTVHRGMFHSLPAAVIAAEIAFLAHVCPDPRARLALAGGVLLGFLSHLVLDVLYGMGGGGGKARFNKAVGSPLKLVSRSVPATLVAWLLLGAFTYLVGTEQGYWKPIPLGAYTSMWARR
jgi:membrane-bound metal-dependent hydrolase YbcI (DUF457 family)